MGSPGAYRLPFPYYIAVLPRDRAREQEVVQIGLSFPAYYIFPFLQEQCSLLHQLWATARAEREIAGGRCGGTVEERSLTGSNGNYASIQWQSVTE
jgi:hypothetical protein